MSLIYREALIEILTTAIKNVEGMAKLIDAENDPAIKMEIKAYTYILESVKEQPSIEPEPQWIPCVDGNEPKANAECWISTNAKYVWRASYAPKANNQPNGFIVTDGAFGFYEYGKSAKAWMPYTKEPEPYREGET